MRTVFVHFRDATKEQVEDLLTDTYSLQKGTQGSQWIHTVDGDPCLYIWIHPDLEDDCEPEEFADLLDSLGGKPTVTVIANVSGRHPGDMQVREFVSKLLTKFKGLASDDFTEGFWTLDDILSGETKPYRWQDGKRVRTFFDYRGECE